MGTYLKFPNFSETKTRLSLQKCIVANCDIKIGDNFSSKNIIAKRTGGEGISPIYISELYSKKATKNYTKNEIIKE